MIDHKVHITTSLKSSLWSLAKENNIGWSQALEFGLTFLLAEGMVNDYPDCKMKERLDKAIKRLNSNEEEDDESNKSNNT